MAHADKVARYNSMTQDEKDFHAFMIKRELDFKIFGGHKTRKEKHKILEAEVLQSEKLFAKVNSNICTTIIAALLKQKGTKGCKEYLKVHRGEFLKLLNQDELNDIFLECKKLKDQ